MIYLQLKSIIVCYYLEFYKIIFIIKIINCFTIFCNTFRVVKQVIRYINNIKYHKSSISGIPLGLLCVLLFEYNTLLVKTPTTSENPPNMAIVQLLKNYGGFVTRTLVTSICSSIIPSRYTNN